MQNVDKLLEYLEAIYAKESRICQDLEYSPSIYKVNVPFTLEELYGLVKLLTNVRNH